MHNRITLNKNRIVEMQKPNIAANEWSAAMDDKTKRLTIDVTETLHRALKIRAVTMAEIVRQLLMQQFGQDSG